MLNLPKLLGFLLLKFVSALSVRKPCMRGATDPLSSQLLLVDSRFYYFGEEISIQCKI